MFINPFARPNGNPRNGKARPVRNHSGPRKGRLKLHPNWKEVERYSIDDGLSILYSEVYWMNAPDEELSEFFAVAPDVVRKNARERYLDHVKWFGDVLGLPASTFPDPEGATADGLRTGGKKVIQRYKALHSGRKNRRA